MIADLLERGDGREHHRLLASESMLHSLRLEELAVEVLLKVRQADADDFHNLRRKVVTQHLVGAAQNERLHEMAKLGATLAAKFAVGVAAVRLAPSQYRDLVPAPKLRDRAKHARVREVNHGVELVEFVLHRCARQQHTAATRQLHQRLVCCRLSIFQPMRLVTDEQITRGGGTWTALPGSGEEGGRIVLLLHAASKESLVVNAECLVRQDHHLVYSLRVDEVADGTHDETLGRLAQRQRFDVYLLVPC